MPLSDLGVTTQEFSGRRLRTDFTVGIPSDFYAGSYGQTEILLDAAYTDDVLPGSHIDVYVNDNIAATYPINAGGGAILRHLPVKVTMRHFRPGDNRIAIEAVLMTAADATCAPGATALNNQRFVLFDTSEFVMPDFARIGRTPDLAALSGTGFPYNRADYELPVVVDRTQSEALSTAATLLARMSVAAGRLIPIDTTQTMASVADRNALIVGPISQIPATVLAQVGISPDSRTNWGEVVSSIGPNTQTKFDEWRNRLSGSGWRGQIGRFEQWMSDTFDISMDSFALLPGPLSPYDPPPGSSIMIAQQPSPSGDGLWTVVTSPSINSLEDDMGSLVSQANWRQLGGRISSFDGAAEKVQTVASTSVSFIETQPFSISNYRLIAANWLSANAFAYSIVLTILSILLGLATAGFLGSLGRRR
jgi:cellulose synthase operon protein B